MHPAAVVLAANDFPCLLFSTLLSGLRKASLTQLGGLPLSPPGKGILLALVMQAGGVGLIDW